MRETGSTSISGQRSGLQFPPVSRPVTHLFSLATGMTIGPWLRNMRPRNNTHQVRNLGTHLGTLRKRFPAAYLGQL